MSHPDDYLPTASLENLRQRGEIVRRIREYFQQHGFLEVTTPMLSQDTVVDRYIEPFRVTVFSDPRDATRGPTWYLQTSPEFHMKRLLAAGARSIYQITHAFRAAEIGPHHNLEFQILEWYRVGDDLHAAINFLASFFEAITGSSPTVRMSYQEAFLQYVNLDPFTVSVRELKQHAEGLASDDRDDLLDWVLNQHIVPQWPRECATIVYDYPPQMAALAAIRHEPGAPAKAERFELYWRGTELANGYHELRSAEELRRRFDVVNQRRTEAECQTLPVESRLLAAMQSGLPPCSGVALGIDRLVMTMLGLRLDEVTAFPSPRA